MKKVFLTGAASGIGRATALRFAAEGWQVCLLDIREQKLEAVFNSLPGSGHLCHTGSYADPACVGAVAESIRQRWGNLDALVNCAGVSGQTDILETELSQWRILFDLMVDGCLLTSRHAARLMAGGGRIVHISSIHGERAERFAGSYAMAKAAINQCCRAMALEWADRGILVNAVAPGFVDTPMAAATGENELETPWFHENYVKGHHLPLRRAARPEEIAGVAFFLAGNDASYITGQVLTVDGGLTITF